MGEQNCLLCTTEHLFQHTAFHAVQAEDHLVRVQIEEAAQDGAPLPRR